MNHYLIGADVLGAVTIPKAGQVYTDKVTVTAVQQALVAKGFKLKYGVDGKFGPDTAQAIRAMQKSIGVPETGIIDEGVLMSLGVRAPGSPPQIEVQPVPTPSSDPFASLFQPRPQTVETAPAQAAGASLSFWNQPLWDGAPLKRWQGAVGVAGGAAMMIGLWQLAKR